MRRITIDLTRCVLPCLTCDMIVPGLRARIEKRGPLVTENWAWIENQNRLQRLVAECPCGAVSVTDDTI